ncbi:4-hydroxythreonine-4-phosphate dehydrogenase PdxA [Marinicauda salina]|uniref:4-hydroxythreonine-4-phosphate dehydrogenase n=1 Tax=Marinicauda salina TaxID=2135793 RepID=A0A2U2BTL6_9PROT|nr:4-hydroxythreonine-4-phosphate dehydrogenase PdxA [Marinicauda salina]PWE17343.1 4-hydroxythreonine-4-phosphate dehydrogenase PdxA [Marinicauda salina]
MNDAPLALTMGDPAGIGPEIALKAWNALRARREACFAVTGDPDAMARAARALDLTAPQVIAHMREAAAAFPERLPVLPVQDASASPEAATIAAIERAVELALSGEAGGVVTNPVSKAALYAAGFTFPGHTEFIDHLTRSAGTSGPRGPVMMLAAPELKTALVTIHLPLREAIAAITTERIIHVARVVQQALTRDFGLAEPRLAVAGLNPHAGEGGALGREEIEIVAPAIEALVAEGVAATGPHPPDTMFHAEARAKYDAAICLYHDQGLIPVKTLNFHGGVNVTLGLPIVRTSPDHGVAYDIAGEGIARADSLIAAIRMAGEMAHNRARADDNA